MNEDSFSGQRGHARALELKADTDSHCVRLTRWTILLQLEEPTHTAVLVAMLTGLRVSKLLALKWEDIDSEAFEIHIIRSISLQHVGKCKTEASRKPMLLDERLVETLQRWRALCAYRRSPNHHGVYKSILRKRKNRYWRNLASSMFFQDSSWTARGPPSYESGLR
jgi:integrase